MGSNEYSIVEYFGLGDAQECGYCKKISSKTSTGMWAHALCCQDYQDLLDKGWRRSGAYVYKPEMKTTCCPQYTIRCDATQFVLTKSQKKVLKKMNKYLRYGRDNISKDKEGSLSIANDDVPGERLSAYQLDAVNQPIADKDELLQNETEKNIVASKNVTVKELEPDCIKSKNNICDKGSSSSDRPKCKKAKEIRMERRKERLEKKGLASTDVTKRSPVLKNKEKTLEDYIEETLGVDLLHRLEVVMLPVHEDHKFVEYVKGEGFHLFCKYQQNIHHDKEEKLTYRRVKIISSSPPNAEFMSLFKEEHNIFQKYQMAIHKDTKNDCAENQFKRFLVDCPLIAEKSDDNVIPGYGAFHCQYRLDGKLIGVSVLDILPNCVSSKYFFYDPDYNFLSLGTYSALRELYLIRSYAKRKPSLKYYYLGFYIHNCVKMRYKGQYRASYLLCPETYTWVPIEECTKLLDKSKYSRFNQEAEGHTSIDSTLILHSRQLMTFKDYIQLYVRSESERKRQFEIVQRYADLVGQTCAGQILLYRK